MRWRSAREMPFGARPTFYVRRARLQRFENLACGAETAGDGVDDA